MIGFLTFCEWFDDVLEDRLYTIPELYNKYKEFTDAEPYSSVWFKKLFIKEFGERVYIVDNEKGRKNIVCVKNSLKAILRDFHAKQEDDNAEVEERRILKAAALIIVNACKSKKMDPHRYPSPKEMGQKCDLVPSSMEYFLSFFIKSESLQNIWGQNLMKALRPRSGVMPYQL